MIKTLKKILTAIGPGIMAIGFTIGTGSVTSMIVAGSRFGMQLLWVLILSCLFSWVLMNAYGRFSLVSNQTALSGIRKNIKYGNWIAIFIIVGISFGQINSLIGILGIVSNSIFELSSLYFPELSRSSNSFILSISILILLIFYYLLWKGSYTLFEKVLVVFVVLMGLSFLGSLFVLHPSLSEVSRGFIPTIPQVNEGNTMVVAFVGTTMAAATFISRPLFLKGKGWNSSNLKEQENDAMWSAILILIISSSIMAVATAALYSQGKVIEKVLDMIYTLEPIAGRMAVIIFFLGTLSAGLSSIFPILMITPLMISDFQNGEMDTNSKQFKIITGIICVIGLYAPLVGANPIKIQILSQVFNVFVLPLVILAIIIMVNKRSIMGENKAGLLLNIGLFAAGFFSILITKNGLKVLFF
jgi:manganese transport protein